MVLRVILMLVISIGVAALGSIGWVATHAQPPSNQAAPTPPPVSVKVIVSTAFLHAGSLVRPQDIQTHDFPRDALAAGAIIDSPDARIRLTGALLRISVPPGGVMLPTALVFPGDHGYLAAVLAPGSRAVSVGVDAVSGNAGLIWPGDRVDLILTQSLEDAAVPLNRRMVAETVMGDLRVIATDQDLVRGELPASSGQSTRTITLEATPVQAQRITIASRMGRLSLTLRAIDGNDALDASAMPRPSWSGDASPALTIGDRAVKPDNSVHLFDGTGDQKEFHF